MSTKKILIAGCSWGVGEFVNDGVELKVAHPGLVHYLGEKYLVNNLSRSGGSNWQSCFALRNYLEHRADREQNPTIFVLQTDMARSTLSEKFHVNYDLILDNSTSLVEYYTSLLEIFYLKLNALAEQQGIKINMIGALTDLDLTILSLYNNLIPCCESWIKLLNDNHTSSAIPLIFKQDFFATVKKRNNTILMEQIIEWSDDKFLEAQELMETEYFGPAYGDYHPSRLGHKILADYIKDYLKD